MKILKRLAWIIATLIGLYFAGHLLLSLRSVPIETTAFWMVIRFFIGVSLGFILGFITLALIASGKMEDARRAIYDAVHGDLSGCKQFVKEGR